MTPLINQSDHVQILFNMHWPQIDSSGRKNTVLLISVFCLKEEFSVLSFFSDHLNKASFSDLLMKDLCRCTILLSLVVL